jgi:hypothetical protein
VFSIDVEDTKPLETGNAQQGRLEKIETEREREKGKK